jgi:hypothetical protein
VPKYLQHPNLYPLTTWSRLICGISFPPICQPCSPFCPTLISPCRTKCSLPFIRPSRASGLAKADEGNECREAPGDNRHPSTALVCSTGVMAGSMVGWHLDGRLMCDVAQVRTAVARSRAARTCCHRNCRQSQDPHSGWFPARARAGLSELKDHLYLVYTPAYDPDANRIEWHGPHLATRCDP